MKGFIIRRVLLLFASLLLFLDVGEGCVKEKVG